MDRAWPAHWSGCRSQPEKIGRLPTGIIPDPAFRAPTGADLPEPQYKREGSARSVSNRPPPPSHTLTVAANERTSSARARLPTSTRRRAPKRSSTSRTTVCRDVQTQKKALSGSRNHRLRRFAKLDAVLGLVPGADVAAGVVAGDLARGLQHHVGPAPGGRFAPLHGQHLRCLLLHADLAEKLQRGLALHRVDGEADGNQHLPEAWLPESDHDPRGESEDGPAGLRWGLDAVPAQGVATQCAALRTIAAAIDTDGPRSTLGLARTCLVGPDIRAVRIIFGRLLCSPHLSRSCRAA